MYKGIYSFFDLLSKIATVVVAIVAIFGYFYTVKPTYELKHLEREYKQVEEKSILLKIQNNDLNNTTTPLIISQDNLLNDPECYIDGVMSNFRWVKGLGVYTQSGFTVATSDLTAISVANPYGGSYTEAIGSGYTKYLLID